MVVVDEEEGGDKMVAAAVAASRLVLTLPHPLRKDSRNSR